MVESEEAEMKRLSEAEQLNSKGQKITRKIEGQGRRDHCRWSSEISSFSFPSPISHLIQTQYPHLFLMDWFLFGAMK